MVNTYGQPININTLILSKASFDALSDKTKKELDTHAITYLIVDEDPTDHTRSTNLTNAVFKFKWMWDIIVSAANTAKAAGELSRLKHSIATIKGALE